MQQTDRGEGGSWPMLLRPHRFAAGRSKCSVNLAECAGRALVGVAKLPARLGAHGSLHITLQQKDSSGQHRHGDVGTQYVFV
jgi:hypothetical protein